MEKFGGTIGFKSKWQKGSTFAYRMELENDLVETRAQDMDKTVKMGQDQ